MSPRVQVVLVLDQNAPVPDEPPGVVVGIAFRLGHYAALYPGRQTQTGQRNYAALDLADHHLQVRLGRQEGVLDLKGVGLVLDHLLEHHGELLQVGVQFRQVVGYLKQKGKISH